MKERREDDLDLNSITQEEWDSLSEADQKVVADQILEDQQEEKQTAAQASYGFPDPPTKDSIYKFFRELLQKEDSSKIGNVKKEELGNLRLTIRSYRNIANFCGIMKLNTWSDWAASKGEITLATSLSRDGFLPKLFVTQIKQEKKVTGDRIIKRGLFGGDKVIENPGGGEL